MFSSNVYEFSVGVLCQGVAQAVSSVSAVVVQMSQFRQQKISQVVRTLEADLKRSFPHR
jgi:hypothetical protein